MSLVCDRGCCELVPLAVIGHELHRLIRHVNERIRLDYRDERHATPSLYRRLCKYFAVCIDFVTNANGEPSSRPEVAIRHRQCFVAI